MRILLIIPAYNEAGNILTTVESLRELQLPQDCQLDYLIINDGSTDATEVVCRENGLHCLTLIRNLGIGGAVQTGYLYALRNSYDIAVQFDGDGQHDIRSLPALISPIVNGQAEFVVGSRFLDSASDFQSTALRRLGIRYLSALIRLLSGVRILDITSGYRAAGKRVIHIFAEDYQADYPEPESLICLHKKGIPICEVPVNMFARRGGNSSIGPLNSLYYMAKVSVAMVCAAIKRERNVI